MQATLETRSAEPTSIPELQRILLVEDEPLVADVVRRYLRLAGYEVAVSPDGDSCLSAMPRFRPHLVLLDLNLPGMDGMDVFRRLRATSDVPVIVLTSRSSESDRVAGLDAGVEDYVTKPFFPKELVARVRRELARVRAGAPRRDRLTGGPLVLDIASRRLTVDGRPVTLTPLELELLAFLMRRPGEVVSRTALLEQVWGYRFGDASTVTVHVRRLRSKIEADPAAPALIRTAWGAGYSFDATTA